MTNIATAAPDEPFNERKLIQLLMPRSAQQLQPLCVSVSEAATMLRTNSRNIKHLWKTKQIRGLRVGKGKSLRILVDSLHSYVRVMAQTYQNQK